MSSSLSIDTIPAKALMKYVPSGHSPKLYVEMTKHLMGTDQSGNARPVEDLLIFLMTAKRTGLDPVAKQIYPIYRWDSRIGAEKMTIQAGIDGLRATAQGTKQYAGSDDAVFEEKDGKPIKATVTVYKLNEKTGERMPTTASARYSEYVQTKFNKTTKQEEVMGLWKKMPYNQLAKCAEALALRKAFPNYLSGVYSEDEMGQAAALDLPAPTVVGGKPTVEAEVVQSEKAPISPPPMPVDEKTKVVQKPVQISTPIVGVDKVKLADSDQKISDIRAKLKIKGDIEKLREEIKMYDGELANYEKHPTDTDQFRRALADEKRKQEARKEKLKEMEAQV